MLLQKFLPFLCLLLPAPVFAADAPPLSTPADWIWVSVSAALVFFMQAGFALLEGGSVRSKNTVNVLMKNYADLCLGVVVFWGLGYALMFGSNPSGWIGTDQFLPTPASNRDAVFLLFQMMFAATAATIVSGAIAERMQFGAYALASMIVTGLIYPVFGSWAWGSWVEGQGWLARLGFIDFAGSTVVHSVGGWCSLAAIMVVGPRLGRYGAEGEVRPIPGHNLPLVALGGFVLWLGWFGFNGGSTLAANERIGPVLLNTHMAGAAGFVGALLWQRRSGPVLMSVNVNGAIGGLVAITAGCNVVTPASALLIGAIAGIIVCLGQTLMDDLHLDDVVSAVPVHAFCGAWGTLAAGLFYKDGTFELHRVAVQAVGVISAFLFVFPAALLSFWLVKKLVGLRAPSLHEQRGLDFTEHQELGYPEFQRDRTHGDRR